MNHFPAESHAALDAASMLTLIGRRILGSSPRMTKKGTSINCRERPEDKADGTQKPLFYPPNEIFGSRNKLIEVP